MLRRNKDLRSPWVVTLNSWFVIFLDLHDACIRRALASKLWDSATDAQSVLMLDDMALVGHGPTLRAVPAACDD